MEWWRGVTRSRCHVWRSDETKWAGIIINTLPSPLHSRYTTEYHRNLGICGGLLDTTDNTERRSVDISIEASYLCRCILHEQLCIMRFCIEGFGIRKIRLRHAWRDYIWRHKMDWRRLFCHFFWIYFSISCLFNDFSLVDKKCRAKLCILDDISRRIGLVNVVQLW